MKYYYCVLVNVCFCELRSGHAKFTVPPLNEWNLILRSVLITYLNSAFSHPDTFTWMQNAWAWPLCMLRIWILPSNIQIPSLGCKIHDRYACYVECIHRMYSSWHLRFSEFLWSCGLALSAKLNQFIHGGRHCWCTMECTEHGASICGMMLTLCALGKQKEIWL
jgi:hypothetical protein